MGLWFGDRLSNYDQFVISIYPIGQMIDNNVRLFFFRGRILVMLLRYTLPVGWRKIEKKYILYFGFIFFFIRTLSIEANHIELDALESNGNQWRVLRTDCVTEIFIPDCCPELFIPQVRFTIEMIRKKSLEIYLIHLPILCSILFNLFSITLDPYRNRYVRFFLNRIAFIVLLIISLYLMNRFGEATFARTNLGWNFWRIESNRFES